jgi:3-oxoadipate enol-lactonase
VTHPSRPAPGRADLPTGVAVTYVDTGDPAPAPGAPVLVLSHGFLLDHRMFDPQLAGLADRYRLISWDQRGHGDTPAPGPFDYWDSARDLLALLDLLGVQRAVLVGMSQGGFVSLRAALLAPDRVRALVLIDSQAGLEDPAAVPLYEAMHATWLRDGPSPALVDAALGMVLGPDPELAAPFAAAAVTRPRDQVPAPVRALMDRDDVTERLAEITVPALVVHGSADLSIPLARARALAGGLRGAGEVLVVEGAAHASNLTHPAEVTAAVRAFVAALD